MAADVALLGSSSDHGGTIISASPDVHACGIQVARCGDRHACPIPGHGVTEIVVCDPTVFANGRGVARVSDKAGCGATSTTATTAWRIRAEWPADRREDRPVNEPEIEGTKRRLVDAAEKLISERGPAGVSLREITSEAGANVAAVNYHFHGKEGLLRAVCSRRLDPLQDRRTRLLALVEDAAGEAAPSVEDIVHAFVEPAFDLHRRHPRFLRVLSHILVLSLEERAAYIDLEQVRQVVAGFAAALSSALPEVPLPDIVWGLSFMHGALMDTWVRLLEIRAISDGVATYDTEETMMTRLVAFATGGLRALDRQDGRTSPAGGGIPPRA
jgi:AcrR family transcriptional regulator/uncharacterized Zn-binding protein involved in type VI secretion